MHVLANGLQIKIDDQGPRDGPVLLLIMGLGMQLIAWPEELVQALVAKGFRVVRFDNRDIGLSQGFDDRGVPSMPLAAIRYALRMSVPHVYTLREMAQDALGVMDALGVARAHVCGASMGGMIAQHIAVGAPSRVASLSLIMTSSGSRKLPMPSLQVQRELMSRPMGQGPGQEDAAVAWVQRLFRVIGSPAYPTRPERLQARAQVFVQRAWHPAGSARQLLAIMADGDRSALLPRIESPTLVIHGVADPLVPIECGRQLAEQIRGAQADFIEGMGHDLPEALLERMAQGIAANARRG
ncbi:MAG: alpha/beta fold hydrolase [Rubrivivax sp.]|nr:alpha/beta fold hydrolase [Rubrivivax sp.]